jgi:hypothetical protein
MRDTRGQEMKQILQNAYPDNRFSVRLRRGSMSESFSIETDVVPETPEHVSYL